MTEELTYARAGVDVEKGDRASHRALEHARRTFGFRADRPGRALQLDGVFTGLVDVGPFYIALNSDGVGSKAVVAHTMRRYDTLGHDLLAMVADDAACAGAEPTALVNTLDVDTVDEAVVDSLMQGLEDACRLARVSVVGGEIAELRDQLNGFSWSAALIGLLRKDRVLGPHRVRAGDEVVGLLTDNFRANGFTLLRRALETKLGAEWHREAYDTERTWGDIALAPSHLFAPFLTKLTGGFDQDPLAAVSALAHITGGGLYNNVARVIPKDLQVRWSTLPDPPEPMQRAIRLTGISPDEARLAWNMGIGMAVITPSPNEVLAAAAREQVPAISLGKVVAA